MRGLLLALIVIPVLLSGCSGGHDNEMRVIVSNPTRHDVEVWLRIESVRGDMKHNEPLDVAAGEVEEFSMGDLQGSLRFTAIVLGHTHTDLEQMEPDEDWTIDVRDDGTTCFWFGIVGDGASATEADYRCG